MPDLDPILSRLHSDHTQQQRSAYSAQLATEDPGPRLPFRSFNAGTDAARSLYPLRLWSEGYESVNLLNGCSQAKRGPKMIWMGGDVLTYIYPIHVKEILKLQWMCRVS